MDQSNFIISPVNLLWILSAVLGILFLWKLLTQYFETPVILLTALLILFGTNYFWLIVFAGPTANTFLFTLFLLMILLTNAWETQRHWIPLLAMLPVMILISFLSGTGVFILLFPVLALMKHPLLPFWGGAGGGVSPVSGEDRQLLHKADWLQTFFLAGVLVTCLILRNIPWFTGPGAEFYYGDLLKSKFSLVPGNIHRILFSVKNGWLIYSPLIIFALAGFYFLAEKSRAMFLAAFLFILASLVSAASNPTWWFDNRFGYPNLVETYAVLCLPLGYLIQWAWIRNLKTRILLFVLSALLVSLNFFQTWQFTRSVILPGRMTGKYYCATFGKTSLSGTEKLLLDPSGPGVADSIPDEPWISCRSIAYYDFENRMDDGETFRVERAAHSGKFGMLLNFQNRFSPGLTISMGQLAERDSTRINATGYYFFKCKNSANKVFLVMTCTHQGAPYKYRVTDLSAARYRPNRWNKITMHYLIPFSVDPDDLFKVYFMNFGEEEGYLDDFEIKLCKPIS